MQRELVSGLILVSCLINPNVLADPYTPTVPAVPTPSATTTDAAKKAATSEPSTPTPQASPKKPESTAVPIKSNWRERAMKWFTAGDVKGQRKEMRKATRALKKPCRHCHSRDFKSYTDKRLIAQQMMALSVEHGVQCEDCHGGRDTMTEMGRKAVHMWKLAHDKGVFCEHCHVPAKKFGELTQAGQEFKDESK